MTEMVEIVIQMDETWSWWALPVAECTEDNQYNYARHDLQERVAAVEVEQAWFEEYKQVQAKYFEMKDKLEHLYRYQRGYEPFLQSPFHPDNITQGDSNV